MVLDCDVLLLFCRTLTQILYYTIVLSVAGMSGNPFLNFLLQALIELPGFLVGRAVCDRLGRRWSQAGAFVLTGCLQLACLVITVREYRLPYRDCYSIGHSQGSDSVSCKEERQRTDARMSYSPFVFMRLRIYISARTEFSIGFAESLQASTGEVP
jgi:hypothetical protein